MELKTFASKSRTGMNTLQITVIGGVVGEKLQWSPKAVFWQKVIVARAESKLQYISRSN